MKKNPYYACFFSSHRLKKLITIMRLSFILNLLCTVAFSANTFSQSENISMNLKNAKVKEIFKTIENQSNYRFFYNDELSDINRTVNLKVKDSNIKDVLHQLFSNTDISYTILENDLIVVAPKRAIQQKISGKVTDAATGEPLPGVNIVVKGTTIGTISDLNGSYSIDIPDTSAVLVFSFVGYLSEEVAYSGQSTVNVALVVSMKELDQIVVIGYGTMKKGDVTSSVASVKSDQFIKGDVTDAGQLLQGKVAGLSVISPNGDPTSSTQILLRGNTSLMGANQNPLVLIDGIPGDLNTVPTQDIESIDVLKDGSAAAIYGTRGTNGVIFITTKRAKGINKNTVEYSTYVSTQTIARKLNISTAADFRAQMAAGYRTTEMFDNGYSTDWLKEISRTPLIQSHNLTFRGGQEKTNYMISLDYNNNEGIFRKSYKEVFSGLADFNHTMLDGKLKFNVNLFSASNKWNGFNQNIYREAMMQNPTSPVKNEDGTWFEELTKFDYQNPVSELYESDGQTNEVNTRYKGSVIFTPIKDLKFTGVFSYGKRVRENGYSETKQNVSTLRDNRNGYANIGGEESIDRLVELTGEYAKSINNHRFVILGGYSYQDNTYNNYYMQNWDFPTDLFGYNTIQLGQAISSGKYDGMINSYRSATNLVGFFGRLTYNYKEKYLLMASIRSEEASQLWGAKNPWVIPRCFCRLETNQ